MIKKLKNKTIGVFFGGQSPEHEVSIITGEFAVSTLRKAGYNVVAVYIARDGAWYADKILSELKFFKQDYKAKLDNLTKYKLNLQSSKTKLVLESNSLFGNKKVEIDYVLPAFHGLYGEDGTVQGLCEFFRVPYAGCGIYTSALSMDKTLTKEFYTNNTINTTDFVTIQKEEWKDKREEIIDNIGAELQLPMFVKPARAGSSIGISKVKKKEDIIDAIELAFYYDTSVVVENGVENLIDLTCAVREDDTGRVSASKVQESLFGDADMFDYNVKYMEDGGAQTGNASSNLVIPARVSDEIIKSIQTQSVEIFKQVRAGGTLRVDFLLNKKTQELFVNEINTLPGTFYHHLWEKSGVSIIDVLEGMLHAGLKKWQSEQAIHADFASDVLNVANSMKLQQAK